MSDIKTCFLSVAVIFAAVTFAQADNAPQSGTVVSEESVNCGSKGGSRSKKSLDLLCQEYIVHSASTDYHVRQEKPGDKALIPVNSQVQFSLDKDKMKFKVDGKSYEYVIVSEAAAAGGSNR
jgi:hypothetical protein